MPLLPALRWAGPGLRRRRRQRRAATLACTDTASDERLHIGWSAVELDEGAGTPYDGMLVSSLDADDPLAGEVGFLSSGQVSSIGVQGETPVVTVETDVASGPTGQVVSCAIGADGSLTLFMTEPLDSTVIHDWPLPAGRGSGLDDCAVSVTADGVVAMALREGDEISIGSVALP